MTKLRVFIAWAVLATATFSFSAQAQALAGGIDGCFFRDLDGSSVQGDSTNPGASGEVAFTDQITVQLIDASGSSATVTATTDPVTGCFEFPNLTAGTNYQINVTYPPEYFSSPNGGDTDFAPGPPPSVAGDPFTSTYNFTYNAGDDLSITGGVSGLPELSLGYFVTPGGNQLIETGTATFNTTGSCPTQVPGDDCGEFDDIVRTNDETTIGYTITADNIPDPNTNPLNDVVLEQVIVPNPGAVVEVPSLHPSCLTTGVSPVSGIAVDPATGIITVTCNLGPKGNGTSIIPTFIRTDGASIDGSSFEVSARVYSGTDRSQVTEDSLLAPEEIFVSAAPRFDITKGNDASNPFNRVIYLQTTERVNPVTGISEFGANYSWDISVLYDGGTKGQAGLVDPVTFSDLIPPEFVGWDLVSCTNTPWPNGGLPLDSAGVEDWGDRGTWSCVEDRANNEIDITVTNVDTDGDPVPTAGDNGTNLASGPFIAFAGRVHIWYPLSDFYRSVDPTWQEGDEPITGDYSLDNLITNFDPVDVTGQSNFGDDEEPTENNDRTVNVRISETGAFSKHLGSFEWADARINGRETGPNSIWPCGAASIAAGSLMSGQTQACSSGDAPVQPGEKAHFWFWTRNNGTFPWSADTVELCDAFDATTMSLTTWTGGTPVYIRGSLPASAYIVEYATVGFNNDPTANDWTDQLAAVNDCTAPNNDWSADPLSFDADPTTSLESIGMIRIRLDTSVVSEVLPSQFIQVSFPVEIRDTFNGGPNDGAAIPVGTVLANNANRQFGSTPYSNTFFDAENYINSPWGDRLFLNRFQVRVSKATSIDPTSPTNDDLFNVSGSDTVVWWLQPAVTAVTPAVAPNVQVIDTLPAGITFDPFCQASQAYPDANVTLTSVTNNPDGTTTLLFDLGDRPTNVAIGPIPVCTTVDNFLEPSTDLTNNVEITADGDQSPEGTRSDERTISVVAAGEFQLVKEVDAPLELQLDTQTYTIGWINLSDDFDFSPPDVIDVWPYNGDAVNPINERNEFDSRFSGSYELTTWMPQPTTISASGGTSVTNGTWYYSADNPNTIPYDADDPVNDLAVPGGVNWCTQAELTAGIAPCNFTFSDSTAVRFVQDDILTSKSSVTVEYTFQAGTATNPNQPADRYVNRFAARTDSVSDLIRSNEVLVQVLSMNLGDLVFLDADVDGTYTAGVDVPVQGTAVELWIDDGTGNFVFFDSTTTDANGRYVFLELLQGTYEVRIPDAELNGGTLNTLTQTILPLPADNDANEDVDQQAFDSGLGYTTSGPVTLSANTLLDPPLGLEPVGENLFNLGDPLTFDNLTNLTVDLGFRGDPDIEIIKEVCDSALGSCDLTTDPLDPNDGWVETVLVPFTDTAVWRISVTNTGFEVLTDIAIADSAEPACDQAIGSIPDLLIGETYSYTCSTTNVLAGFTNTAAVTAAGAGSGQEVDDEDDAAVTTPPVDPDLDIIKFVNGNDANTAPGIFLNPGTPVTFTYEVTTGAGTVPLENVMLSDDNGTPTDPTDDFNAVFVSGDTDGDGILDLDETWLYEATGFVATVGQYTNWATATVTPVTPGSEDLTDSDPASFFGVDGGLELTKFVNDDDADSAPGILVPAGDPVTFTYTVENTGNIELTIGTFTDDAGTPGDATDDWTPVLVSGDSDGDGLLDVNETWTFEHTGEVAEGGAYTNLAAVDATDVIGNEFTDSDPANYFGTEPAFELEKSTNTFDADTNPVPVAAGSVVNWEYVLVNTGNVDITNPRVEDDAGTPADPTDDFFAAFSSGDTDNDGVLDVGETWIFTASGTATEASYTNNAVASGTAPPTVDEDGNPVPGAPLTDDDPSSYVVASPGIDITKATNGVDNTAAPGSLVVPGDAVTWTYTVTNTGDVPLSNVAVADDNGTPADPTDDLVGTFVSGDTNSDGILDLTETWIFEATGIAIAGQYENNATVTGTPPDIINPDGTSSTPDPVDAEDDDFYYGISPAIDIIKATNTVDNTAAPGVLVTPGDPVTWTYFVTNPGDVPLSNVTVTDDNGTPADLTDDFIGTFVSGDANSDGLLDVGETWIFEASGIAIADQYQNNAVVTGTPPDVTNADGTTSTPPPVDAEDDDFYFGITPQVAIIKLTNSVDNTSAPGVLVEPGDTVVWTYTVTNPGNVPLSGVSVVDDNGTPADPTDDLTGAFVSGDTNGDGFLDPGETWIFEADGIAVVGQYQNNAVVTGTPPDVTNPDGTTSTPDDVTDEDDDFFFGIEPAIEIVKATNGTDSSAAPGVLVQPGDPVTWTYTVTNPGNIALLNVTVSDDNGTPADPTDDLTGTFVSGDANGDGSLDVGEIWVFEASGIAVAGQYENNAVVTGTPPDTTNPDGSTTTPDPVTDDDDDYYFGISPEIEIVKATNTVDNTVAPGVLVQPGDPVMWTYTVTNTGNVPLSGVGVTDDNGTPADFTDDFVASFVSGDTNNDGILDLTETWIFEATGIAIVGQYQNNAFTQGTPPDVINDDGTSSTPDPVDAEDDDFYYGISPAIDIVKATNTVDNTVAPGVLVQPGDPVTWTYTVTNPGDVPLSSVGVTDDNGTPADFTDDIVASFVSGDTNNDGILDLTETWIFEASGIAVAGQYQNNAFTQGTPPDVINDDGTTSTPPPVDAEDDDFYYGIDPAIDIVKATNTVDNSTAPGVLVEPGDIVVWTYTVTNPGNVPLSGVSVTDDNGTPADPTDDLVGVFVSGDTNGDGVLDLTETWIFEATGIAIAGQYQNNAVASGTPPDVINDDGTTTTPPPVQDEDDDYYFGIGPGIAVTKLTNGSDNPAGTGPFILAGDPVTWTYAVTNPGDVPLSGVSVTDDNGTPADPTDDLVGVFVSGDTNSDGILDLTETWIFEATGIAVVGQYENNANVTGTPPDVINDDGTTTTPPPVTNSDDDRYYGASPAVEIVKAVNGDDANSAPGLLIPVGDAVSWTYTVTNTGDTPLVNIAVTDDQGVVVTCPATVLGIGESMECTSATQGAILGQYTNIGSVEATPAQPTGVPGEFDPVVDPTTGTPVAPLAADDPANYFGTGPGITIQKEVCDLDDVAGCDIEDDSVWSETTVIANGDDVTWRIAVTNIGNIDLVDVAVSDPIAPSCAQSNPLLGIGETWTYACTESGDTEPTVNTASVEGTPADGDFPPVSSSDDAETLPPAELELIKTAAADDVFVGDTVTYELEVTNSGTQDAVDVEIVDVLPAGLISVVLPAGAPLVYDESAHTITWTIDSLAVDETIAVEYTVTVDSVGTVVNEASISSDHEENHLENNSDSASISVTDRPEPPALAFTGSTVRNFLVWSLSLLFLGGTFLIFALRRRQEEDLA